VKLQIEKLTPELFAEMLPLGQESWDECSEIKKDTCSFHGERGFKIQPFEARYLDLAENDLLLAFVLRDDENVLQGYALAIFYQSLHHEPVSCANVDTFYLRPAVRIAIRSFIALMEEHFEARGVVVVGWPVSPSGGLFGILKALGYAPDDVIMEKRICALQQP
jgi:hypothetical protein